MAVNIKTPVVVENITLMCLRILQKLIKPPAPTSKKNKVLGGQSKREGRGGRPPPAPTSTVPCLLKVSALPSTRLTSGGGDPIASFAVVQQRWVGVSEKEGLSEESQDKINTNI